ncbi:MAG: DUF2911 domain-containing protein [Chitinophagaceae bacterium]
MPKFITATFFVLFSVGAFAQVGRKAEEVCYNPNLVKDTSKKSIKSTAFALFNKDSITINYHSPGVRKRIIWGGLVPLNEVWVTGAHDATTIKFDFPVRVGGKTIPAGKYAFFTIPGKTEWTLIINRQWQQHLATEYEQQEDIVRVKVKPRKNAHTERLQYFVKNAGANKGSIAVAWDKLLVELPISL